MLHLGKFWGISICGIPSNQETTASFLPQTIVCIFHSHSVIFTVQQRWPCNFKKKTRAEATVRYAIWRCLEPRGAETTGVYRDTNSQLDYEGLIGGRREIREVEGSSAGHRRGLYLAVRSPFLFRTMKYRRTVAISYHCRPIRQTTGQ